MVLNKEQKNYLKKLSHELNPIIQIGKDGIHPKLLITIEQALMAHELIKISVLKTYSQEINQLVFDIVAKTHSQLVLKVGRVLVFYRKNKRDPKIILP